MTYTITRNFTDVKSALKNLLGASLELSEDGQRFAIHDEYSDLDQYFDGDWAPMFWQYRAWTARRIDTVAKNRIGCEVDSWDSLASALGVFDHAPSEVTWDWPESSIADAVIKHIARNKDKYDGYRIAYFYGDDRSIEFESTPLTSLTSEDSVEFRNYQGNSSWHATVLYDAEDIVAIAEPCVGKDEAHVFFDSDDWAKQAKNVLVYGLYACGTVTVDADGEVTYDDLCHGFDYQTSREHLEQGGVL